MSQNFDLTKKSIDLMQYTMTITSNRKRYPVKYIQLVKRIQNKSMDLYEYLIDANRLNVKTEKIDRVKLQSKAITTCDKLSCLIEISMNLNLVGANTVVEWQKKISDIKYMTIAWREKDKLR